MNRDMIRKALLLEMHKAVSQAAENAIASTGQHSDPSISYPPGESLSSSELDALRKLDLSEEARNALLKIMHDACTYPIFHLCSLLDGVADPYEIRIDGWTGGKLEPADGNSLMLHDEFYESFEDFRKK